MNTDVEATVKQCPLLTLQVNLGERHRIMRRGMGRGSLWVTPYVSTYLVVVTGEAETLLYSFLCSHFGAELGESQGKKYWKINDIGDVAKIIRRFGQP